MRAFSAIAAAIVRGFVRDRASLFFAVVFPLMFLVFFGGVLSDRGQPAAELVQVGDLALVEEGIRMMTAYLEGYATPAGLEGVPA